MCSVRVGSIVRRVVPAIAPDLSLCDHLQGTRYPFRPHQRARIAVSQIGTFFRLNDTTDPTNDLLKTCLVEEASEVVVVVTVGVEEEDSAEGEVVGTVDFREVVRGAAEVRCRQTRKRNKELFL